MELSLSILVDEEILIIELLGERQLENERKPSGFVHL
jgi:hypothetical protein